MSLLELQDVDVCGMTVGEEGESEGRRLLSWIWRRGSELSSDDKHECVTFVEYPITKLT
jgi:hypothetical protein